LTVLPPTYLPTLPCVFWFVPVFGSFFSFTSRFTCVTFSAAAFWFAPHIPLGLQFLQFGSACCFLGSTVHHVLPFVFHFTTILRFVRSFTFSTVAIRCRLPPTTFYVLSLRSVVLVPTVLVPRSLFVSGVLIIYHFSFLFGDFCRSLVTARSVLVLPTRSIPFCV